MNSTNYKLLALFVGILLVFGLFKASLRETPPPPQPVTKTVVARMTEPSWRGMRWYVVAEDGTYASVPAAKWRVAKKGSTISAFWEDR